MIGPVLGIDLAAAWANGPLRAVAAAALYAISVSIALWWLIRHAPELHPDDPDGFSDEEQVEMQRTRQESE